MKLAQVLLEYKRDITLQKMGSKLDDAGVKDRGKKSEEILDVLERIDSTRNKQHVEWLVRQYIAGRFRVEDEGRIKRVLDQFLNVKNKLEQKDINRYTFHELEAKMDEIHDVKLSDTSDEEVKSSDVKVLYDGPLGKLAIPLTKEASCILGSGTKWCTAAREDNMFDEYSKDGSLYIWKDKSGEKFQFHFETMQFMDDKDEPISQDKLNYFRTENAVTKKMFEIGEKKIADNFSEVCLDYAHLIGGRFELGEKKIAADDATARAYIEHYLNFGRFKAYEDDIIEHQKYWAINEYCKLINRRVPELEDCLLESKDGHLISSYVFSFRKSEWPEAERYIKRAQHMYDYAVGVKHRKPEWEKTIRADFRIWRYYVDHFGISVGELQRMRREDEADA